MDRYYDMVHMDELPKDLNFDLSFLDDEPLYQTANAFNEVKKVQDVVNKDVSLLDMSWMNNFISVQENANSYMNDVAGQPAVNEAFSDTESLVGGGATAGPSPSLSDDGKRCEVVSDEELLRLSVKDLNSLVKTLPKDAVKDIKHRRRTLKNRGYARSCRVKRLKEKSSLQRSNEDLENDVAKLKLQLQMVMGERDIYKTKYEILVRRISQQSQRR